MRQLLLGLFFLSALQADTGYNAWLHYDPIVSQPVLDLYKQLPAVVLQLDQSPTSKSSAQELSRGIHGLLGRHLRLINTPADEDMFVLGTLQEVKTDFPALLLPASVPEDGYLLRNTAANGHRVILVAAQNERGILYGTFALLRHLVLRHELKSLDEQDAPAVPVRWVNEWDNLDGSIERGYAGRSIFFNAGNVVPDLTRASDYARLLASVGINGCTINNVNANPRILAPEFLRQLTRVADAFRPWGVRLSISVPFASPKTAGGLDTFDPLDPKVAAWWQTELNTIYRAIPDLGGLLVKADSEGQAGPSTYNRTHADAANVLAQALAPHGGILIYRGFVYNHHMDWRDLKNDRARAAYDNFHPLDGKFASNVAVQIKYGPIDFQAREPVSPLLGGLPATKKILELQVTQEYTGQQRHLCYLVPMWKQMLDFDLKIEGEHTPVKHLITGFAGVSNVGQDLNWVGYDLAQANLYGFGRLAWNPDLSARQITDEWTRMTWGSDERVVQVVTELELESWRVYEGYTGPLGLGTLTDILHGHYGPGIETAERNGWGQWLRADDKGIGMDRTVATGTGYVAQYPPQVRQLYESPETTPDDLMLFMHHLPYTYKLHSGQTIAQYVYDSHYKAAAEAQEFPVWWSSLRGSVDEARFQSVEARLQYQAGHAIVWRDAICQWFEKMSGIPNNHSRNRQEAEDMQLSNYQVMDVTPWEDASKGKAVSCPVASCQAEMTYKGPAAWRDIAVQYFDTDSGAAQFQLFVNEQLVSAWSADSNLPGERPNGDTSTRKTVRGVALRPGDKLRIQGEPQASDRAALDYVEIEPAQ